MQNINPISPALRTILIITGACAGAIIIFILLFFFYPPLRTYVDERILHMIKNEAPDPLTVNIEEFGSTTESVLIGEGTTDTATSTASSTDLLEDITGKKFLSPESAWASLYLERLGTAQEYLKLDIRYLKEWQQIGGFTRDLKQNSKGSDVKLFQYLLSIFTPEFPANLATGNFGPKTKAALIQLQKKFNMVPNGVFDQEMRYFFDSVYFKELCPDAKPDQDKSYENVSRRISVPIDYIPGDLIRLPRSTKTVGVMCLSKEPAMRLQAMFEDAQKDGHSLAVFSAYRSAYIQNQLVKYYLETIGPAGLAGVAEAGHSEHQLGTTVDISGKSVGYAGPTEKFGNTPEGKWLKENSYKYGFIMSYPQGKFQETGYIYEPWHFRYIGIDIAKDIHDQGFTIQQYFDMIYGTTTQTQTF